MHTTTRFRRLDTQAGTRWIGDLVDLCECVLDKEQTLVKLLAHIEEMYQVVALLPLLLAKHLILQNLRHDALHELTGL